MRRVGVRLAAVTALLGLLVAGCGVLPGGSDGYALTAYFPEAVALYEDSQVKVMGVEVGTVDEIAIEDRRLRVEMTIRDDVPLRADVQAAVMQEGLIGGRAIVLSPPWEPGDARLDAGGTIPMARTRTTIEPDQVLETFDELFSALDPQRVRRLVTGAAGAVDGQGRRFNDVLQQVSQLTGTLENQDDQLLEVADELHTLASTLNTREEQLGDLVASYRAAADVVADERGRIQELLSAVAELNRQSGRLVEDYQDQLPRDLARLTRLAGVLEVNVDSVDRLVAELPPLGRGLLDAYRPDLAALAVRTSGGQTLTDVLNVLLEQFGIPVPDCLELLGMTCEEGA